MGVNFSIEKKLKVRISTRNLHQSLFQHFLRKSCLDPQIMIGSDRIGSDTQNFVNLTFHGEHDGTIFGKVNFSEEFGPVLTLVKISAKVEFSRKNDYLFSQSALFYREKFKSWNFDLGPSPKFVSALF